MVCSSDVNVIWHLPSNFIIIVYRPKTSQILKEIESLLNEQPGDLYMAMKNTNKLDLIKMMEERGVTASMLEGQRNEAAAFGKEAIDDRTSMYHQYGRHAYQTEAYVEQASKTIVSKINLIQ